MRTLRCAKDGRAGPSSVRVVLPMGWLRVGFGDGAVDVARGRR